MLEEICSPHLRLCMDPTNFFSDAEANPDQVRHVIRGGITAESGLFSLAHAKDVAPPKPGAAVTGLSGPGQGILDYPLYLDLLDEHGYEGPLVIENLTEADVPEALAFVEGHIEALAQRKAARLSPRP